MVPLNNLEVSPNFLVSRIRILGPEMVQAAKAAAKLVKFRLFHLVASGFDRSSRGQFFLVHHPILNYIVLGPWIKKIKTLVESNVDIVRSYGDCWNIYVYM